MNAFWFQPKAYGYGATPSSWEGWAVTAVYIVVVIAISLILEYRVRTFPSWAVGLAVIAVATVAFVWIGVKKTEGGWHWRWGPPPSHDASR
jgi:peptidoglycan biosynthesis protein MviN/MurJ (putative lipid II flippase)